MKKEYLFLVIIANFLFLPAIFASENLEIYGKWKIIATGMDGNYKYFSWDDDELNKMHNSVLTLGKTIKYNNKKYSCKKFENDKKELTKDYSEENPAWADAILNQCPLKNKKILKSSELRNLREYFLYCEETHQQIPSNYAVLDEETLLASFSDGLFCLKKVK